MQAEREAEIREQMQKSQENTLEFLKLQQEQEQLDVRSTETNQSFDNSTPLEMNPVYQNMRIQLSNMEVEIAALRAQVQQAESEVSKLQRAVNTIPQVEAELGRLNRDYDVVKAKYEQLLAQLETANIGEDVEASIDEVKFRIIDPPFAELKPAGPKRQLLMSVVLAAAIGVGAALSFLFDQLNPVFFSSREITAVTGLPVLGSVGLLLSARDRQEKRKGRMKVVVAVILLIGTFAVCAYFADMLSPVLRDIVGMDT